MADIDPGDPGSPIFERCADVLDQVPCGVVVFDASGRVAFVNATGRRIGDDAGVSPAPASTTEMARRLGEADTGRPVRADNTPAARALRGELVPAEEYAFAGAAGPGPVFLRIAAGPLRDERGALVGAVAVFEDVTRERGLLADLRRSEDALRLRTRQLEAIVELGQDVANGTPLAALLERAAAIVARTLDVELVEILELLPDDSLLLRAGAGWRPGVVGQHVLSRDFDCQGGLAIRTRAPVVVEDLASETRFTRPPLFVEHRVTSGANVVIDGRGRPFGSLGAHSVRRRTFSVEELGFLRAVANVLAAAGRREQETRRQVERIDALGRLTPRERDVLLLLAEGLDNRRVGERLGIGYTTVRGHVRGILAKLGARTRLEAVARANALGLLAGDAPGAT